MDDMAILMAETILLALNPIEKELVEMKVCSVCGMEKCLDSFSFRNKKMGILQSMCKSCVSDYKKEYAKLNADKLSAYHKEYAANNADKLSSYHKEYRETNIESIKEQGAEYYKLNKDDIKQKQAEYYQEHREEIILRVKEYRETHQEEIKTYRENNIEEIRSNENEYRKRQRRNNPAFKLKHTASVLIRRALKGHKMGRSISKYLPYSFEELKTHIESLFEPWMTWENWGRYNPNKEMWNLDHIIPQSDLPYTSMDDSNFQKCWALSNLRPYSAKQNSIDGATKIRHNKKKKDQNAV